MIIVSIDTVLITSNKDQLVVERIFLPIKTTLLSRVTIDRKALIDSRSTINIVLSLLAKQAGWKILPY